MHASSGQPVAWALRKRERCGGGWLPSRGTRHAGARRWCRWRSTRSGCGSHHRARHKTLDRPVPIAARSASRRLPTGWCLDLRSRHVVHRVGGAQAETAGSDRNLERHVVVLRLRIRNTVSKHRQPFWPSRENSTRQLAVIAATSNVTMVRFPSVRTPGVGRLGVLSCRTPGCQLARQAVGAVRRQVRP